MKKWKQLLIAAGLTLCFGMAVKADTQAAAQVTGLKQTNDSASTVRLECSTVLGAEYYYLEMSQDNKTWITMDVSSSPSFFVGNLNAGTSFYARAGLCNDYSATQKVAGTASVPIEVVTAPTGSVDAVQTNAKTNGISVQGTKVSGANYYILTCGKAVLGQAAGNTVSSTVKMNAGTSYWCDLYACRRSSSGYVAVGNYDYFSAKTLAPAINTRNFGVTNAWLNINNFDFGVSMSYARDGLHFQFATPKGKVKKNAYSTFGSSVSVNDFIEGRFYKYRVRSFVQCGARRVFSGWSGYKYIGMPKSGKIKVRGKGKNKKLTLSFSKVADASGYTVYTSTKEKSGYKKVKNLSAKKRSVTVSKIAGKKIKKRKKYYFKVVPKAKVGKKTYKSQNNVWYSTYIW